MAQRLTRGTAPKLQARRGPGRPRKDGRPPQRSILAQALAEAEEEEMPPAGPGDNVSDETRLEFLERARIALATVDEQKQALRSATGVFNQVIKDAQKAGATQIGWTLKQLRRDPDEIQAEITERNRMLQLAKIPVGIQLGMFEGVGETLAEVLGRQAQQMAAPELDRSGMIPVPPPPVEPTGRDVAEPATSRPLTTRKRLSMPWPTDQPPRRGPDDEPDEEEEKEPEEPDEPDEDEEPPMEVAKSGNEVLERSPDDAHAYKMGERSFRWGRTLNTNPFQPIHPMHDAWIRGWKNAEAAKAR